MIEVDDSRWQEEAARYAALFGKGMIEVLDEEFPLLIDVVIKLTPPKTLAQGRAAVNRDIRKTMRPFDPAAVRSSGIQEVVAKKDWIAYNAIAAKVKSGPMAGSRAIPFGPVEHESRRNRLGRVPGKPLNHVVLGSDAALLHRYIAEVQKRVGFAKSGWLAALRLVGGRVAAGFVERHGTIGGGVEDGRKNPDPSMTAINRTPWAVRKDEGHRIANDAISSRVVSIQAKVKTKLRLASRAAGFDRAA